MATVKFYLDTRHINKEGKSLLSIRIGGANNSASLISTHIHLFETDWDNKKNEIKQSCTYYDVDECNIKLKEDMLKLNMFILSCENIGDMTAKEINDKYYGKEQDKKNVNIDVYELFDRFIAVKVAENPTGRTKASYLYTKSVLQEYKPILRINSLTTEFLEDFSHHLLVERNMSINTVSIHLRQLRAVYNYAILHKYAKKDDYPFSNFKIKTEKTKHRVIAKDDMFQLFDYVPEGVREERAVDLFKLSFYLRGINFKDMLYAKKSDIYDNRLDYVRAKTHKNISIRLEPEAQDIINRYSGDKMILNIIEKKNGGCLSRQKVRPSHGRNIAGQLFSKKNLQETAHRHSSFHLLCPSYLGNNSQKDRH